LRALFQWEAQIERDHGAPLPRIRLSQSHLAGMLGVSRQTLILELQSLQNANIG
jgi:hypothetical protein